MQRIPTGVALAAAAFLLVFSGCTSSSGPCGPGSLTLDATVTADAMDPSALEACKGQDVTIALASQTDAEIHLHGYDIEEDLTAGETTNIKFTADVAGQFIIELHTDTGEIEVAVLTVVEP